MTSMVLEIPGQGRLTVEQQDFVAAGGEGTIYHKGPWAIKLWHDPAPMARMVEKIRRLQVLQHPCIVLPSAPVFDPHQRLLGLCLPWVDGEALPRLFTQDGRTRSGMTDGRVQTFVRHMRDVVHSVHQHGWVLGDGNEFNIIEVQGTPRYIDTDAWVGPGFPGDKVLPSIEDRLAPRFSQDADWFAWAIVSFQMFVGVHPYRGTHPDFKRTDMDGRMRAQASVFDPKVRVPATARPFHTIPPALRAWYEAVFSQGHRGPPPIDFGQGQALQVAARVQPGTGFRLDPLGTLPAAWRFLVAPGVGVVEGDLLVSTETGRVLGSYLPDAVYVQPGPLMALRMQGRSIEATVVQPGLPPSWMSLPVAAQRLWSVGSRVFAVTQKGLLEIRTQPMGDRTLLVTGRQWSVHPDATVFGDGMAIWNALGAQMCVVPTDTGVQILRVPELDGLRPVQMTHQGGVALVSLAAPDGSYRLAVMTIQDGRYTIDLRPADTGDLPVLTYTGVVLSVEPGQVVLEAPKTQLRRTLSGQMGTLLATPQGVLSIDGLSLRRVTLV